MSSRDFTFLNKDDDFSVVLLSNDKKTKRMSEQDSIRSHFKAILPVHLDLSEGYWEIAVDKVILSNRQNNAVKLRVSSKNGDKKLKDVDFTPGVYDTSYEVLDEFINLGSNITLEFDLTHDEYLVGDCDILNKTIGTLNTAFSMSYALSEFEKEYKKKTSNLGEILEAMEIGIRRKKVTYDRYEYDGDIVSNPSSIFKFDFTNRVSY